MTSKIHRAVNFTKKEMQNLKKSSAINEIAIKVSNKEAKKQITQLEKEIDSLQAKINASQTALKNVNIKINGIKDDTSLEERLKMATKTGHKSNYTEQEYGSLDNNIDKSLSENSNYTNAIKQQEILKKNIEEYKSQIDIAKKKLIELSQVSSPKRTITGAKTMNIEKPDISAWDVLKNKIEQIKPAIQAVKQCFKNVFSGSEDPFDLGESGNQLRLIDLKIDKLETKIKGAQEGKIKLSDEDIAKAEVELDKLYNKKQKLENENKGNFFSSFFSSLKKGTLSLNNVSGVTVKIKNTIKQWGGGIKQGLGHVLKYAGALFSLRSIYTTLSSCASSWLSSQNAQAQQLSANINYMKYAMGSVFAPVIQYVTNLVYNLMKAIQSLAYAFSGVNIFAKATASSMNSASGSANKASKSLAGIHNEINNVSDNDSSGGSGSTSPNMDLSQIDTSMNNWVEKIKSKLLLLFEPIKNSWNIYGQPLIESIKNAFAGVEIFIESIGKSFQKVWLNGTGTETINLLLQGLTSIFNIIGNIGKAFSNAWENGDAGTNIIQNLWNGFNNLFSVVQGFAQAIEEWTASESFQEFANSIIGICETLAGWFELVTQKLKEIWDNGGRETFSKLLESISKLITAISSIISFLSPVIEFVLNIVTPAITEVIKIISYVIDALSGLLDFITGVFTGDWEKAWNGIKDYFIGIWNALKTIVVKKFNIIKDIIVSVLNVIKNIWNTVWGWIKQLATNIWNGIKTIISNVINGIKNTISNVLNTIKTVWNNIWNGLKTTVTNIFNGIWNTIKKIINSILGGIEGMANGVVKGINKVIAVMNNLSFDIPDWVPGMGGKKFGFNIGYMNEVSLPRLAKGNVAYDETLAIFGEYSGANTNPEITTPQNIMRETFEDVLSDFNSNNGQPLHVTIQYLGKEIFDDTIEYINSKTRRTGKNTIVTVGD